MYGAKMKKTHDQSILRRSFEPSQKVLLYNSRLHLFPGKLKCRWTGPFIIMSVFPHGPIEIKDPKNGNTFKVNGQRLKPFLKLRSMDVEMTSSEDPSYPKWLSLLVESLAEDFKLSACGRQPSLFSLPFYLFFVYFVFVSLMFFMSSVYHTSLGERTLTLCLTCASPLVLYFWAHWGQWAILV